MKKWLILSLVALTLLSFRMQFPLFVNSGVAYAAQGDDEQDEGGGEEQNQNSGPGIFDKMLMGMGRVATGVAARELVVKKIEEGVFTAARATTEAAYRDAIRLLRRELEAHPDAAEEALNRIRALGEENPNLAQQVARIERDLSQEETAAGAPESDDPDWNDLNRRNHIFRPEHNLSGLIQESGSEKAAFDRIRSAAQSALQDNAIIPNSNGVFSRIPLRVGNFVGLVSGRIVDGYTRISDFWIPSP